jgi:1-acyl-sn-glycerol-3-phosphate acyltransferase
VFILVQESAVKRENLQKIVGYLMPKLINVIYIGLEHIPLEGPVLITTNHLSRFDIPVLFMNGRRKDITALVTDKYKKNPFFHWFATSAGGIWIDRTRADFTAFKESFELLKKGIALGISPEGTRSQTGALLEGKSGSILLATKMDVPIVPVGLAGTEKVVPMFRKLKKPTVIAKFGPAYKLPPIDRKNREESIKELTDEVMCRIAVCLPEKYHGFYAGYTRIREIQTEQS